MEELQFVWNQFVFVFILCNVGNFDYSHCFLQDLRQQQLIIE